MLYHRALGRDLATLAVAVVDNRRSMLLVMRAMLAAIGAGRIDTYESPAEAIDALARTTPDLLIAADLMQPLTGPAFVRTMRRERSGPLALVPAIIMSAHGRPGLVADALRAGAHQVLVLPTAASTLARRLHWLLNDDRPFELRYVVAGIEERLSLNLHRPAYTPAEASYPFLKSMPGGEEPPAIDFAVKARAARN
jgi:CheY-like chemotaxis protein